MNDSITGLPFFPRRLTRRNRGDTLSVIIAPTLDHVKALAEARGLNTPISYRQYRDQFHNEQLELERFDPDRDTTDLRLEMARRFAKHLASHPPVTLYYLQGGDDIYALERYSRAKTNITPEKLFFLTDELWVLGKNGWQQLRDVAGDSRRTYQLSEIEKLPADADAAQESIAPLDEIHDRDSLCRAMSLNVRLFALGLQRLSKEAYFTDWEARILDEVVSWLSVSFGIGAAPVTSESAVERTAWARSRLRDLKLNVQTRAAPTQRGDRLALENVEIALNRIEVFCKQYALLDGHDQIRTGAELIAAMYTTDPSNNT